MLIHSALRTLALLHLVSLALCALHYSLPEERSEGFLVAHIKSDAEVKEGYEPPPVPTRLSILPGPYSDHFTIAPDTGTLRVSGQGIDRDRMCPGQPRCVLTLEVAVTHPVEHWKVFQVQVTVDDINDNAPVFAVEGKRFVLSVLENAEVGTHLDGIPTAKDLDIGKNGVQSYSLLPSEENESFQLQFTEDSEGNRVPVLMLQRKLDRELVDSYDLTLVAYDGGVPPKSGNLRIRVNVIDVNDNPPEFASTQYNISVREDAPPGTVLTRTRATDPDTGHNAALEYALSPSTRDLYGSLFSVNSTTGEVRLISKFSASYLDIYPLTVIAKDGGLPPKSASTKLNVQVIGVNSHPPAIGDDGTRQMIIILLAGVTGTLVIILIVAIIYVCHCRNKKAREGAGGSPSKTHPGMGLAESTFVHNVEYEASLSRDLGMMYEVSRDFKMDDHDESSEMEFCDHVVSCGGRGNVQHSLPQTNP